MFHNSEINIDQVITPFGLRKSILNKKVVIIFQFALKLIHCLKMTSYYMFHKPEINIDKIVSPFGLETSRLRYFITYFCNSFEISQTYSLS